MFVALSAHTSMRLARDRIPDPWGKGLLQSQVSVSTRPRMVIFVAYEPRRRVRGHGSAASSSFKRQMQRRNAATLSTLINEFGALSFPAAP